MGAAVCENAHKRNKSSDLIRWLKKVEIEANVIMNGMVVGSNNISCQKSQLLHNGQFSSPKNKISREEREMLQNGTAERMFPDQDLEEYFKEGFKQDKMNKTIRPIPEGEPIFIMNDSHNRTTSE